MKAVGCPRFRSVGTMCSFCCPHPSRLPIGRRPKPDAQHTWPPPPSRGRDDPGNMWGGGAGDLDGTEIEDCGLSFQDASDLYEGWVANMRPMVQAILDHQGFIWQMSNGGSGLWAEVANYTGSGPWAVRGRSDCAATLRDACREGSKQQTGTLIYHMGLNSTSMQIIDLKQHLASFLLMRGPYGQSVGWSGGRAVGRSGGCVGGCVRGRQRLPVVHRERPSSRALPWSRPLSVPPPRLRPSVVRPWSSLTPSVPLSLYTPALPPF